MQHLAPAYLSTLATQIGSLSAFLGGFAATYLATFLTFGHRSRPAAVAIGGAVTSAVGFVVAVVASTMLIAALHPDAPAGAGRLTGTAQVTMTLSFLVALIALLVSLGVSGWTRSRAIGWATSVAAGLGMVIVLLLVLQTG
ncbi:MAG: hypothetical protein JWN66_4819 [Sphingomonas bacterium]|uniref:hypothetical protein n=1 Tax=Sphingomonas bacterium TaxID=1895847 RepID=UPI0026234237|nr:hypothetical protein [Sphingomonas bacterium]MDB5707703.1 hypothetical protein [Sphingomonas bacterium]